jgi:hypothetical protein
MMCEIHGRGQTAYSGNKPSIQQPRSCRCCPDLGHLAHKHDSAVTSVGFTAEGAADMKKLNGWLSNLLQVSVLD